MSQPLIRRRARGALFGATCLLLAALLAACSQQSGPTPPVVSNSPQAQPPSAPADQAPQPDSAAAESPGDSAAGSPADAPAASQDEPSQADPAAVSSETAPADKVELTSCDGENTVNVSERLTGKALAETLMDQWTRDHPEHNWVAEEKEKHALKPPADNSHVLEGGQRPGQAYGNYSKLDLLTWARETEKFVAEGSRIFHSADALGSTVAVSCDMCHPHAANTHPETYPKFQTQLGRVALLRDMINWCIENPVRGDKLDPDSPTMRALEAYIMAERKGVAMDYGKH